MMEIAIQFESDEQAGQVFDWLCVVLPPPMLTKVFLRRLEVKDV